MVHLQLRLRAEAGIGSVVDASTLFQSKREAHQRTKVPSVAIDPVTRM
jgi:hypothetical protein